MQPKWAVEQITRWSGLIEDVCKHGVGHPNKDYLDGYTTRWGDKHGLDVHGCDGCCTPEDFFDDRPREGAPEEVEAPAATVPAPKAFKKKPLVVTAMQFDGSKESAEAIGTWFSVVVHHHTVGKGEHVMCVPTLEGQMTALPGSWIVRGIKGEVYPVKEDIFEETYEPV